MINGKNSSFWSALWKIVSFLLGYLILGVWITASISASNENITGQIKDMKQDIRHLSDRLDAHIDQNKH